MKITNKNKIIITKNKIIITKNDNKIRQLYLLTYKNYNFLVKY